MTKSAYDKIAAGLHEALEVAAQPTHRLTPAQRRALLWLPKSDLQFPMGLYDPAAPSKADYASLIRKKLVARTKRGECLSPYRLTPAGQAARAQIERDGE